MANTKDEYLVTITRTSKQARRLLSEGWESVPDSNNMTGFLHGNKQAQVLRKKNPDYEPPKSKTVEKAEKAAAKAEKAVVKAERAEERAQRGPGLVSKTATAAISAVRAKLADRAATNVVESEARPTTQAPPRAPTSLPPANWYPDPDAPGQLRYWDGAQWTENRHPQ